MIFNTVGILFGNYFLQRKILGFLLIDFDKARFFKNHRSNYEYFEVQDLSKISGGIMSILSGYVYSLLIEAMLAPRRELKVL